MGAVPGTIEELTAREALHRLVVTYSRAVDRRDFVLLRSLYDDAAYEEHGAMFQGGPDAYVDFVRRAVSAYDSTVHYVVHALFEVRGDEAEGEVHKLNYHRTGGDTPYEIVTGSRSLDRYRRSGGAWRFLSRSITLDWAVKREVSALAYQDFAAGSPPGRPGPDDLSYHALQWFGRANPTV